MYNIWGHAGVVESADAHVWGACIFDVRVQVPFPAPAKGLLRQAFLLFRCGKRGLSPVRAVLTLLAPCIQKRGRVLLALRSKRCHDLRHREKTRAAATLSSLCGCCSIGLFPAPLWAQVEPKGFDLRFYFFIAKRRAVKSSPFHLNSVIVNMLARSLIIIFFPFSVLVLLFCDLYIFHIRIHKTQFLI